MNFTDLRILKTQERLQNALLELLETKELKAITVKEICDNAGISRNAFYQHYGYKEDLYDQMVEQATERFREALSPVISDPSGMEDNTIEIYAHKIIRGVTEVRDLIYVMLKGDDGKFLRQLTDLIFEQLLANALSFFSLQDCKELHLYYEFQAGGIAAFIIKWILQDELSEEQAEAVLLDILKQKPSQKPKQY